MTKIFDFSKFFGNETNIWISCWTMKTDDLDLGQKVKILNFSYEKMNSQTARLFLYTKSGLKAERRQKKSIEKNI